MLHVTGSADTNEMNRPRRMTGGWLAACACLAAVPAACAEAKAKPDRYPASETLCQYVGLESAETPQHSDRDSISLLAVYRFRESSVPAPKEPLTVKFQVNRSRMDELRSHLEAQPEVICTPDRDAHYHVQVKPFGVDPEPAGPVQIAPPLPPAGQSGPSGPSGQGVGPGGPTPPSPAAPTAPPAAAGSVP